MDPARQYFEDTNTYQAVKNFWLQRVTEGTYLDFTTSPEGNGRLSEGNKKKVCEAASGFAHQEGGVVIWGVVAAPSDRGDFAQKGDPIKNLAAFHGELENFSKDAVEPRLTIEHKRIYLNDDPSIDEGFIVSFFPKSDLLHKTSKLPYNFYRRFGSSFVPVVTKSDLQALLNRDLAPHLELRAIAYPDSSIRNSDGVEIPTTCRIHFSLFNSGRGIAKNPSILLGGSVSFGTWYDQNGSQSLDFWCAQNALNSLFNKQLIPKAGLVIHPEQEVFVLQVAVNTTRVHPITYKCFAEGMAPTEGIIDLGSIS